MGQNNQALHRNVDIDTEVADSFAQREDAWSKGSVPFCASPYAYIMLICNDLWY